MSNLEHLVKELKELYKMLSKYELIPLVENGIYLNA